MLHMPYHIAMTPSSDLARNGPTKLKASGVFECFDLMLSVL